ncbi:MAG: hypothetical protein WCI18_07035 [Pseudomonadota bacterium]
MSQGLPSLDLNMDGSAPQKDAGKDQPFRPLPSSSFSGIQEKNAKEQGSAGGHNFLEVTASLLEGAETTGFDATKQGQQPAKDQIQDMSIPNSAAFWESGQNKDGSSLVTGPKLLGAKSEMSVSSIGELMTRGNLRIYVMIGVLVSLVALVVFMKPELLSSIPGWDSITGEKSTNETTDNPLGVADPNQVESSTVSDPSSVPSDPALTHQGAGGMELTWQENPYWFLPNDLDQKIAPPTVKWNPEQEEAWGSSSEGSVMWAKYQSLFEIRKLPRLGAEQVLWKLSKGKKFWLRIMSLMALAEMGQKIETAHVEQSIEGVSPELISRFVTRFEKKSTVGERLILRFLLKLVNEDARYSILKGLAFQKDRFSYLYLVAGTYDPGVSVSSFSRRQILKLHPEELERLKKVVTGEATFGLPPPTKDTMVHEVTDSAPATSSGPLEKELQANLDSEAADSTSPKNESQSQDESLSPETLNSADIAEEVPSDNTDSSLKKTSAVDNSSAGPEKGSEEGTK